MSYNLGKLTAEETMQLFLECAAELTEEQLFEALATALTTEQKQELAEAWG